MHADTQIEQHPLTRLNLSVDKCIKTLQCATCNFYRAEFQTKIKVSEIFLTIRLE